MPGVQINIAHRRPLVGTTWTQKEGLRWLREFLDGVLGNSREADAVHWSFNDGVAVNSIDTCPGPAVGILAGSGVSGAVGGTLGGTLVTVTTAGGDIGTATLLAAAIRANTTVNRFLTASNKLAQMTFTSVVAGTTLSVFGMTFTAIANGVTPAAFGQFSVGASDTAAALNFVTAFNQMPGISMRARAVSLAGSIFIGAWDDRTPLSYERITSTAATISVGAAIPVAGARTMIFANAPGQLGNFVTAVASGTGMTYITNGTAGQLGQGCGGCAITQDVIP